MGRSHDQEKAAKSSLLYLAWALSCQQKAGPCQIGMISNDCPASDYNFAFWLTFLWTQLPDFSFFLRLLAHRYIHLQMYYTEDSAERKILSKILCKELAYTHV